MTDRERFEAWISAPPFERRVSRFPENPRLSGWPGHYRDHAVQLAWEAWQEAQPDESQQEAFERGFRAGLREGPGNKCAACNGHGTIMRGYGPSRCDACDGKGY